MSSQSESRGAIPRVAPLTPLALAGIGSETNDYNLNIPPTSTPVSRRTVVLQSRARSYAS